GTPQGEARIENLNELRGLAESFDDRDPAQGLEDFLDEVALASDVDAYDENGEGVTLITLHMVKGLEFAVVVMVVREAGLLPDERYIGREVGSGPVPPPVQRFATGDRVTHLAFGSGTVVKSTLTRTDEELVIKFDKVGLKILSGMLAPLTK